MKKVCIMTLILVMTMSLSACRRNENSKPTETIPPATEQTVPVTKPTVPAIDPTLDTNIPDPSVDSNSDMTDKSFVNQRLDLTVGIQEFRGRKRPGIRIS